MNSFVKTTKISVAGAAVAGRGRQQTDERRLNLKPDKIAYFGPYSTSRKIRENGRKCTDRILDVRKRSRPSIGRFQISAVLLVSFLCL